VTEFIKNSLNHHHLFIFVYKNRIDINHFIKKFIQQKGGGERLHAPEAVSSEISQEDSKSKMHNPEKIQSPEVHGTSSRRFTYEVVPLAP
jgi:hypothetical protein